MSPMRSFWRNLIRRDTVERELDEEMRATVDLLTAEKIRAGMTRDGARRAALVEIGGVESVKQQVRDFRRAAFADTLLRAVRYALPILWSSASFTRARARS